MKQIPNLLTCLNLLSGCIAVVFVMAGEVQTGCYLVFLAALFDFFDGFAARALNAWSPIGKELDSLADVVSFGLVPGLIVYRILQPGDFPVAGQEWAFAAFLIPVFSALRLARFNVDESQKTSFRGLPTPACGLFIAALPAVADLSPALDALFRNPVFMLPLTLVLSYLLIAPLSLPSLKFSRDDRKGNRFRYIFLGMGLLLILLLNFAAIPVIIVLYLLSPVFIGKKNIDRG